MPANNWWSNDLSNRDLQHQINISWMLMSDYIRQRHSFFLVITIFIWTRWSSSVGFQPLPIMELTVKGSVHLFSTCSRTGSWQHPKLRKSLLTQTFAMKNEKYKHVKSFCGWQYPLLFFLLWMIWWISLWVSNKLFFIVK